MREVVSGVTQKGVLLVNLGTPDAATPAAVRRYLKEFLSDPRVVDLAAPLRWFLVNAIILPLRPKASSLAYRSIWEKRGSPLKFHSMDLVEKLRMSLPEHIHVELAMRYQNPSIAAALRSMAARHVTSLTVLPLFPQYSSAAWGSAVEKVFAEAKKAWNVKAIKIIEPFYDHPKFIRAIAARFREQIREGTFDKVLISFHGLPERHCMKSDPTGQHCLKQTNCCNKIHGANVFCYRAQCVATARAVARELNLSEDQWELGFQSRLGRTPWIKPYTDERVVSLAKSGVKRLVVISPSFVADCLETLEEIGIRAQKQFVQHGGEELRLVPALNSSEPWVDAVLEMMDS